MITNDVQTERDYFFSTTQRMCQLITQDFVKVNLLSFIKYIISWRTEHFDIMTNKVAFNQSRE